MKITFIFEPREWALPIAVGYCDATVISIQILCFYIDIEWRIK